MRSQILKSAAALAPLFGCIALLALAGCEQQAAKQSQADEFNWARAALERNPGLDVIAADSQAGIFTVRIKRTGDTQTVQLKDLAAAPVADLTTLALAPATETAPLRSAQPAEEARLAQASAEPSAAEPSEESGLPKAPTPMPTWAEKGYTIERSDGRLKVSGPGVSIVSSGKSAAPGLQEAAAQQPTDPLICEGHRMLHVDNRSIYVEGNAIVARGGCELYITNSRVSATGTAVVAQDSIVHIANSTLEGSSASFEAGNGARMYLRSSTFQGLPRRAEKAVIQDQGGNTWR